MSPLLQWTKCNAPLCLSINQRPYEYKRQRTGPVDSQMIENTQPLTLLNHNLVMAQCIIGYAKGRLLRGDQGFDIDCFHHRSLFFGRLHVVFRLIMILNF
jgi:hypothetical protein